MKAVFIILLCMVFLVNGNSQSPFNYGQNMQVYFISTEERIQLSINEIITINLLPDNENGGMSQNCDVLIMSFDSVAFSDNWYPVYIDSFSEFSIELALSDLHYLNGNSYYFSNQHAIEYGGEGYGSFDWKEFKHLSDSVTFVTTFCVGHCGNQPAGYSKNVYNDLGQIVYTVVYPQIDETEIQAVPEDSIPEWLNAYAFNSEHPDTTYYYYDKNGLLLNINNFKKIADVSYIKQLYVNEIDANPFKFHQCLIGDIAMETYLQDKLGMTPELVFFELYRQAVVIFAINKKDEKYYPMPEVILER